MEPLQTCESYFWTLIRCALQKTVQVDTRFFQDTVDMLLKTDLCWHNLLCCATEDAEDVSTDETESAREAVAILGKE